MNPKVSLQLWSIQDVCQKDFFGTLRQVQEAGYDGVEFAGYYDKQATDIRSLLDELELDVSGSHIGFDQLRDNLEKVLSFEKALGNNRLIVPYLHGESEEEWQTLIDEMILIEEKVRQAGFTLLYHNHAHEFVNGQDKVSDLSQAMPHLGLEVDTYWLAYADIPVLPWLEAHREQVELLHIKDMMGEGEARESTEITKGMLPIDDYVSWAKTHQLEWLVVEQEAFQTLTPMESAVANRAALKQVIKG